MKDLFLLISLCFNWVLVVSFVVFIISSNHHIKSLKEENENMNEYIKLLSKKKDK